MAFLFVNELSELTNKVVCREFLEYVWKKQHDWDENSTKQWLIDNANQLKELESEWKAKKEEKRQLLNRYIYDEPVSKVLTPYTSNEAPSKIRYIDNQIATSKGEKYITEKVGEEWNGGSKGKVYTKGKRGKGYI